MNATPLATTGGFVCRGHLWIGALSLVLLSVPASAQNSSAFEGKWTANWVTPNGMARARASLQISGTGGTWQSMGRSDRDACIGLPTPVSVSEVTAEGFLLSVQGSKAMRGCTDFELRFKRKAEAEFVGELPDGRPVMLSR